MKARRYMFATTFLLYLGLMPFQPAGAATLPDSTSDSLAVLLIQDNSGSMGKNDPQGLRFTAARLFVALLDEGDSVGLIRFSTQSRALSQGLVRIKDDMDKTTLLQLLQSDPAEGFTDVKAAFSEAQLMLNQSSLGDQRVVLVFLTDGDPEIPQPYPEYETEAIKQAKALDIPVLSIALTPAAQTPFLSWLAVETGGMVIPADTASDLLDAYLQIFSQVKDRTLLGNGRTSAPGEVSLVLDPGLAPFVENASFIISKPHSVIAVLQSPDGQEITAQTPGVDFAVVDDPFFTVITLDHPAGGEWLLRLAGSGLVQARAILHSRLRLHSEMPALIQEAGQPLPIQVQMVEEQLNGEQVNVVGEATISALITRPDSQQERLDRFFDDGTHGDQHVGDGVFTRLYSNTHQPGIYHITLEGWKGVVPVFAESQVTIVEFPHLVLDAPQAGRYDVRRDPLTIQVHLEGGNLANLDRGKMVAIIAPPSGALQEIELLPEKNYFTGSYMPIQDGLYQMTAQAIQATYMSLPYRQILQTSFEIRLIPAITVNRNELDFGRVELGELAQGVAFTIPITSTSVKPEFIQLQLEDLPGLTILPQGEATITPGENQLNFALASLAAVSPGDYKGRLKLSARQDLDLNNSSLFVRLEVYQATVRLQSNILQAESKATCPAWQGQLVLPLSVDIPVTQPLRFRLESTGENSLGQIQVSPERTNLSPGQSDFNQTLLLSGPLPAGEYQTRLFLEGGTGLSVIPVDGVPVRILVPPIWVRCRQPLAGGGATLVILVMTSVLVVGRLKAANRVPDVTGTLRYWVTGNDSKALGKRTSNVSEVDLTALKLPEVTIGRSETCTISIPDPSLAEVQAILRAVSKGGRDQTLLIPVGEIRIRYRILQAEKPLNHEDTFVIGERTFQFLSDEGM